MATVAGSNDKVFTDEVFLTLGDDPDTLSVMSPTDYAINDGTQSLTNKEIPSDVVDKTAIENKPVTTSPPIVKDPIVTDTVIMDPINEAGAGANEVLDCIINGSDKKIKSLLLLIIVVIVIVYLFKK